MTSYAELTDALIFKLEECLKIYKNNIIAMQSDEMGEMYLYINDDFKTYILCHDKFQELSYNEIEEFLGELISGAIEVIDTLDADLTRYFIDGEKAIYFKFENNGYISSEPIGIDELKNLSQIAKH